MHVPYGAVSIMDGNRTLHHLGISPSTTRGTGDWDLLATFWVEKRRTIVSLGVLPLAVLGGSTSASPAIQGIPTAPANA